MRGKTSLETILILKDEEVHNYQKVCDTEGKNLEQETIKTTDMSG